MLSNTIAREASGDRIAAEAREAGQSGVPGAGKVTAAGFERQTEAAETLANTTKVLIASREPRHSEKDARCRLEGRTAMTTGSIRREGGTP
jgi:hypothetical protein